MKLGLHLPQIGRPEPDEIARCATIAEQAGYESIWVSDHILVPSSGGTLPAIEIMEPVATLAYVAAVTKRIKLATSVIVLPYRNPIHLAKELATVDILSGGRLVAGVASGWLESEFRALNAPYQRRGAYADESIRLMRALWAEDSPSFRGEFFDLSGMRFGPRPAPARFRSSWVASASAPCAARWNLAMDGTAPGCVPKRWPSAFSGFAS